MKGSSEVLRTSEPISSYGTDTFHAERSPSPLHQDIYGNQKLSRKQLNVVSSQNLPPQSDPVSGENALTKLPLQTNQQFNVTGSDPTLRLDIGERKSYNDKTPQKLIEKNRQNSRA